MDHKHPEPAADAGFFRNTGFALVALTLITGSISLIGSLTFFPAENTGVYSYGIEADRNVAAPAE